MPRSKATRAVHVSFMAQDRHGSWHTVSPRGSDDFNAPIDRLSMRYSVQAASVPQECDHIGGELAEYGRAMMGLSPVEALRIGATIQAMIASRFAGDAARVSFRDGSVLLGTLVSSFNGETYCMAGFLSGGPVLENADAVVVDIPLAPMPDIDAGSGVQP